MTKDEALKLALEALTWANKEINKWRDDAYGYEPEDYPEIMSAIAAIKEALAQAEQEPVGEAQQMSELSDGFTHCIWDARVIPVGTKLYAAPPQRKPLTDEQVNLFINGRGDEHDEDYVEATGDGYGLTDADLVKLVRRVEAAHGIKENT